MLAEFEFPASHASQAQRFCDVLQRGCRGVPEDAEARRWLYDKARLKYAKLDRSKQAVGGYLHSWRNFKRKLAKQGVDITDRVDNDYDNLEAHLCERFTVVAGAAAKPQVIIFDPACACETDSMC